jgi:uncharacterized protein with NAD-binding domain and iron-sulfur cluster
VKVSNKIIKQIIFEEVRRTLHEELTNSDKDKIRQIAKKEAEEQLKDFIKDELKKEFQKNLKNKDSKDQIAEVAKKILKKFYHEIAFTYPQFIDRMKL